MTKIQRIDKKSQSGSVHLVYIPNEEIIKAKLKKGDEVKVKAISKGVITIKKE